MDADLALHLTQSGISLSARTDRGWQGLGVAAWSAPSLGASLAEMHRRALEIDPDGPRVTLVLPTEQIAMADAPAADPGRRTARLAGTEPPLWASVPVTVIEEAEAFAGRHGFVPVGCAGPAGLSGRSEPPWFGRGRDARTREAPPVASEPAQAAESAPTAASQARRDDGRPKPWRRALLAVAAAAVVGGVGIGAALLIRPEPEPVIAERVVAAEQAPAAIAPSVAVEPPQSRPAPPFAQRAPDPPGTGLHPRPSERDLDRLDQPGLDPDVASDALALGPPARPPTRPGRPAAPVAPEAPVPPGLQAPLLPPVMQSPVVPPEPRSGFIAFGERPALLPDRRPDRPVEIVTEAEPEAPIGPRPSARPANLAERAERARFGGRTAEELRSLRPGLRPDRPRPPPRQSASTAAASIAPVTPSRPVQQAPRSDGAAGATGITGATQRNAIAMDRIALLGTFGSASDRRALVRLPSGRVIDVAVGDRMDGGRVAGIAEGELRYTKAGRAMVLRLPPG